MNLDEISLETDDELVPKSMEEPTDSRTCSWCRDLLFAPVDSELQYTSLSKVDGHN